ncbi:MAG: hypothetical protein K8W52_38800 [Deltaproteobacteria bacterium]|nr:hypothetical protein [Deltaproteobacteria bacterium]
MFEHRKSPLLSRRLFARRMVRTLGLMGALIAGALTIGILGYRTIGGLGWVDSILEASMILGGMGPVAPMRDDAAKLFASGYALFAGVVFISSIGIFAAPLFHRVLHRFHLDENTP